MHEAVAPFDRFRQRIETVEIIAVGYANVLEDGLVAVGRPLEDKLVDRLLPNPGRIECCGHGQQRTRPDRTLRVTENLVDPQTVDQKVEGALLAQQQAKRAVQSL